MDGSHDGSTRHFWPLSVTEPFLIVNATPPDRVGRHSPGQPVAA